jgi:ATP-dependent RNA helicase DHX57
VVVIDSGRVKETQYDPQSGLTRLVERWTSKAASKQRRGRAGRVRDGECFKLFTRLQESTMDDQPKPEIVRVPLDSLCLQIKVNSLLESPYWLLIFCYILGHERE